MLLGSLFTRFYHTHPPGPVYLESPLFSGALVFYGGCFKQPLSLPNCNLGHLARARHEIAAAPGPPLAMGSGESAAFLAVAPEPTVGNRQQRPHDAARRSSTPRRAPKIPKNSPLPLAVQFRLFGFFPDPPEHKKALQGLRTASGGGGFLRDFGFNSKKSPAPRWQQPHHRVGIMALQAP